MPARRASPAHISQDLSASSATSGTGLGAGTRENYGAVVKPKMSELPKVGAQACCGAGRGTVVPSRSD